MFHDFTPVTALLGGLLIGASASLLLLGNGRIAGICGIYAGVVRPRGGDVAWRLSFLAGLIGAGAVTVLLWPTAYAYTLPRSPGAVVAAGLLVGYGTRLGNGCTSGHGVCGLSRQSPRSLAATVTFMGAGFLVAAAITHLAGGAL